MIPLPLMVMFLPAVSGQRAFYHRTGRKVKRDAVSGGEKRFAAIHVSPAPVAVVAGHPLKSRHGAPVGADRRQGRGLCRGRTGGSESGEWS